MSGLISHRRTYKIIFVFLVLDNVLDVFVEKQLLRIGRNIHIVDYEALRMRNGQVVSGNISCFYIKCYHFLLIVAIDWMYEFD